MSLAEYLEAHAEDHLADLFALLRIPSVSTDPARRADVRRAAESLARELGDAGFEGELLETGGHPAVFAERRVDRARPTVLIYGHYDVQPPDPVGGWDGDPFEPTVRDGAIVARGASDDKGQVYAHVKAVRALLDTDGELPVNVKFLIEGEEEIGSPNLARTVEANRERLASDVVLVSDGAMLEGPTPTVTYGLRGMTYLEVAVRTADRDLHSGAYGGVVPNPIQALAEMIGSLKDRDGRITVPGFYDDVRPLDEEERATLARAPVNEEVLRRSIGVSATPGEPGYSLVERMWARPTLDVNGIGGGFQGEGSKTVIPDRAFAKISARLVPDQDPEVIFERLAEALRRNAPEGAEVEMRHLNGGRPALTRLDTAAVRAATRAIGTVDGRDPVFVRTGGSIPVVADFQRLLGADVLLLDLGLEADRIHSPNEKFDVALYRRGIRLGAEVLRELAHG